MSEIPADVMKTAREHAKEWSRIDPDQYQGDFEADLATNIAEVVMADLAALSSAAVAEREPYGYVDEKSGCFYADHTPNPDGLTAVYLDPPPTSELEAEIARLQADLEVAQWELDKVKAEIEARDRDPVGLQYKRRAEAAEARLAEAMKALEPFADIADLIDSETEGMSETDELSLHFHDYLLASWPVALFRAARCVREGGKVE